jgi:hypothetical protein
MIVAVRGNYEQSGIAGCKDQTTRRQGKFTRLQNRNYLHSEFGNAREALSEED